MEIGGLTLVVVLVVLAFILGAMSIRIIRPYQKGLIERLGKYHATIDPGLNIIIPFLDRMLMVDMREIVLDVPPQYIITKDNVNVEVDCVVYCQITDPRKSKYEIGNYILASTKLAQTNLRNVLGEMDLDQSLTSRDVINDQLREVLDNATDKWGVKVNRVEIQRIDPPIDITEAMSRQMKAERDKRAAILEAEGQMRSAIEVAEGQRQAVVLAAEGEAESVQKRADAEKYRQIAVAEGEAQAISNVFNAIHAGKPNNELITLKYLEMLPTLAQGDANKIFLPYEASGIIGALATMVEGVKDKAQKPPTAPRVESA